MRKTRFATKPVDVSKFSDQHQRMIAIALGFLEFTVSQERTLIVIAEECDMMSERFWEIALEKRRQRLESFRG